MATNQGVDQDLFAYIDNSVKHTPFYNLLGAELTVLGPGYAEFEIVTEDKHTNPMGLIHGGLIMSAADAAMGNAIRSLGIMGVTVDCSTSFIAAIPKGEVLVAKGRVVRAGKKLVFARAEVWGKERIVGDIKGTFAVMGAITPHKEEADHDE